MPPAPAALLDAAEELLQAGRPRVAARLLAALATTGHAPVAVTVARARAALVQDQPAAALDLLACIVTDAPLLADPLLGTLAASVWHVHARALQAVGEMRAACRSAASAASLDPCAETIGLHAMLLMQCGEAARAATLLDDAISAGTADVGLHAALAVAFLQLGEPAAAAAAATRGLQTHPADAGLRRLRDLGEAA